MIEQKLLTKLKKLPSQISKGTFVSLLPCAILGWFIILAIGLQAGNVWNTHTIWYSILAIPGIAAITGIVYAISAARIKREFFSESDEPLNRFYERLLRIRDEHRKQAEKSVNVYRQIVKSLKEIKQHEGVKANMSQSIQNLTMMIVEQTQNIQTLEDKLASYSLNEMESRLRQEPSNSELIENIESYKNIRAYIESMRERIDRAVQSMDSAYLNILNAPESMNRNIKEVNDCRSAMERSSRLYDEMRSLQL